MPHLVPVVLLGVACSIALPAQTPLAATRIATGFTRPVYLTSPPGDEDRLFVCEQETGLVRIIKRGTVLPAPFLDIRTLLAPTGERGLLGLAFHPLYAINGYLYVSYTRAGDGASVIARYTRSAVDPEQADPASGVVCFGPIAQPFANHNGGNIQFGPDGKLYYGLGDGGSAGDPGCRAQNPQSLLGKMLRLDVSTMPFSAPSDNPFTGNAAYRPEIWSVGLRNPWRFSFDRYTGNLWIGDVGQDDLEEVDFEPAHAGGRNYGWKVMEGTNCFSSSGCAGTVPPCHSPALTAPIHTYATANDCSVVGGYVYRGCAIPDLRGTYFFADFCSARIWSMRYDGVSVNDLRERTTELIPNAGSIGSISSFGEDARGELYIVDHEDGEIFKIDARDGGPVVDLGFGKVGGNGEIPLFEVCGRLERGSTADFTLRRAPPFTIAVLALSSSNMPTSIWGGTLVPVPPQIALPLATDGLGRVWLRVAGRPGRSVVYGQWLLFDPGASFSVGISNALRITTS